MAEKKGRGMFAEALMKQFLFGIHGRMSHRVHVHQKLNQILDYRYETLEKRFGRRDEG